MVLGSVSCPAAGSCAVVGTKSGDKLPSPVVGITADGAGYLLVTKAGNVYPFNTAFYGSKAGQKLPAPVIGITAER